MARDYYDRDRNMWERSRDEVRSWFGDEEAERRRMHDQRESDWEEQSRLRGNPYRDSGHQRDMADAEFDRDWDLDDQGSYGPFRNDRPIGGWHGRDPQSNYGGSRAGRWGRGGERDMARRTGRYQDMDADFGPGRADFGPGGRQYGRTYGYGSGGGRHTADPSGGSRYYSDYRHDEYRGSEDFSGRGPGGYRRADERIQEDVNEALTWDRRLDATDITVEVKDGIANLSGHVRDRRMKRRAEDIVESVRGINDVYNRLSVGGNGGTASAMGNAGTHGKGEHGQNAGESTRSTQSGNDSGQKHDRDFKI